MAWTSWWRASRPITSGIVSLVSPPAQSTGLLRLHRGGSSRSMSSRRSSGSTSSWRSGSLVIGVGSDDAPATGRRQHDDVGPGRRRLGGERGGRLEGLFDRRRPGDADRPARPVEHLVVGGQRAGVARRRAGAALGRAALDQHQRLAGGGLAEPLEQDAAVADALDVGQADGSRVVVGVVVEEVGDADGGGVPGRHGAADADARGARQVEEAGHEVAALAGDADAAGRRERGDHLGAQLDRRADDALAVRARRAGSRARRTARRARPRPACRRRLPRRSRPTSRRRPSPPCRRTPGAGPGWPMPACTRRRGRSSRPAARTDRRPSGRRARPRAGGCCRTPDPRSRWPAGCA